MRKWSFRILVIICLVAAGTALKLWILVPEPIPVTITTVERGRVEETVTNSRAGTVKARQRAQLSPEVGGRVVAIPYRKGDTVKAGDILFRVNDASQQAALLLAQQELVVANAQRERSCLEAQRAKREFARNKKLRERELISTDLLDELHSAAETSAASCEAAKAKIDRAHAAIVEAKAELEKTVFLAPFSGIVAELDIEVGEWTTPSPPGLPIPPVIDLIDPSSIYISAPMDEVDSAKIHLSQPVRVTLDPYPDQHFSATVVRVAPYVLDIEEQNRTVEIDVELEDKKFASSLLPGTSADVEVILTVKEDVLRIPSSTIFEGKKVFMVKNAQLVEREVEIGLKNWDYTQIISGLSEGEAVVTSLDQIGLTDGIRVLVKKPNANP